MAAVRTTRIGTFGGPANDDNAPSRLVLVFSTSPQNVTAAHGDKPFKFANLPFELRNRIYELVAISCKDIKVHRWSRHRHPSESMSRIRNGNHSALLNPHRHTLHNLMRTSWTYHTEAHQALYRHVPAVVSVIHGALSQALWLYRKDDIELFPLREIDAHTAIAVQLDDCPNLNDFSYFLHWWSTSTAQRHPQTRLRVSLFAPGLATLSRWISNHFNPDLLRRAVRFSLEGYEDVEGFENVEERVRTRTLVLFQATRVIKQQHERELLRLRAFCCKHHELIESDVDWASVLGDDLKDSASKKVMWISL